MAIDNDLSALLPEPPPARPARREAAIGEALRRFDGHGPAAPAPASPRPASARRGWGRPQIAALASAALVVLVSVPVWWAERERIAPPRPPTAVTVPTAAERARTSAAAPPSATATSASAASSTAAPVEPAPPRAPAAIEASLNKLPQFVPAQTPSGTVAPADAPATSATNTSRLTAAPPRASPALLAPAPPPPPPPARTARQAAAEADADEDSRIVVTGSRVERGDFEARTPIAAVADAAPLDGAWNACTLHDPRRNPAACRESAGQAATQLNRGLALAWQGDLDRAIEAFDRAIAADPDLALAYLDRGLAWQSKGDLGRALADLDRAVARDRTGARAYYHRSLLHRARGDTARADADARRAIELDPAYQAVLP
jgi:hypothetical protein